VSKNVTTHRLSAVCTGEESAGSRVTLDLIGHEHRDIELCDILSVVMCDEVYQCLPTFSNMGKLGEKLIELLLSLVQLATTHKVNTEECHDAVDDQKTVLIANEELGDLVQQLQLMFRIDSASISDVVLSLWTSTNRLDM
jgi:hypothetical protein